VPDGARYRRRLLCRTGDHGRRPQIDRGHLGGERSISALAYSLAWLGASFGGIAMRQAAERFGVRATVIFGSLMITTGLLLAQSGNAMTLLIG
jgi:hypothetical protein